MKLEHLIQAYNFNKIPAAIEKEIEQDKERAGVIKYYDGISGSYLLDNEDIVIKMKIFFNCLTEEEKILDNQLSHIIKIINVMQQTIMLLSNITQKEANMILDKLGLFNNTFKQAKQIKHLEHIYKVEVVSGLLCLSINEIELIKE